MSVLIQISYNGNNSYSGECEPGKPVSGDEAMPVEDTFDARVYAKDEAQFTSELSEALEVLSAKVRPIKLSSNKGPQFLPQASNLEEENRLLRERLAELEN